MNENEESVRTAQLFRVLPGITEPPGRMLYVGGHFRYGRNLQMTAPFREAGWKIDIVEAFPNNVAQLSNAKWINSVFCMDIRHFWTSEKYDITMFWHGPEHLEKWELPALIERMKTYSDRIILATPNGRYDQGDEYGNPFEKHVSTWYIDDFVKLGLQADAIGLPDRKQGNIIAWI